MTIAPSAEGLRLEAHYGDRVVRCWADRPESLHALLAQAAAKDAEAEAVVCGDERLTYGELLRRSAALAAGLQDRGIARGDRVALLLRNSTAFVVALFAVARLGAVAVPLNVREQTPEILHILGDCGARAVVFHAGLAERLPPAADLPDLAVRIAADGAVAGVYRYEDLIAGAAAPAPAAVDEEDLAWIVYTSGTTGRPKGAMLTHLGLVQMALQYERCMKAAAGDRMIVAVPLSHVTGLTASILVMVRAGGTLVLMEEFKADAFLDLADREAMSLTTMVPAMYKLCLMNEAFARVNLSRWRLGAYGGAIMPVALIEELAAHLPRLGLLNLYGATETCGAVTAMPPEGTIQRPESVGRPVDIAEVVVMDDDGRQAPPGGSGEVWLRSGTTSRGYWNNPQATAREFVAGFWKSGDIGTLDDEGYLRIHDRKKDMINRGGYKIYSAEVEGVLARHPDILESAVISSPCPVLGERVHAIVVPRGEAVDVASVRELCVASLSDYKVPESFVVRREPLPRNANGKVLKRTLSLPAPDSQV
jgi:acyl-CoA synthetase (AMP-forming)/AMP-acid ligase II